MSARQALEGRKHAGFAQAMARLIAERGMTKKDFVVKVHGEKSKGANTYGILAGSQGASPRTLERFALALNMPVAELVALQGASYNLPAPPKPAVKPPERERRAEPDQFSLVVDSRGRATLRLNLVDVPMERAMRAMGALTSAGLLGTEGTSE